MFNSVQHTYINSGWLDMQNNKSHVWCCVVQTFFLAQNRSCIVYEDEWAIFACDGVFHLSKFRTETITPVENSICFLQSTPMPLGSTCEPSSCMSSLFHWEFSSSFFQQPGKRGRRGGATRIQRLICLLVKRSSGLHFLMRALIKSRRVRGGGLLARER